MTPEGLARYGRVERLVFETDDEDAIAAAVDRFCRRHLGAGVGQRVFRRTSVGAVFGIELADGRPVVVKAHVPARSVEFLEAVHRVQSHLHRRGFPAPRPLLGPTPLGHGLAVAEELVDRGTYADAHDPSVRRTLAETLARLLALAREYGAPDGLRHGWSLYAGDGLWPAEPHSPIFDFPGTVRGAEWIDALARRSKPRVLAAPGALVAGHGDWSAKHFRFEDGAVSAVYDWDSLTLASEAKLVGTAAATFTANPELGVPLAPTPDEVHAFVDDYSAARAAPLSRADREAVAAVATYVFAYVARCEHALGVRADFTRALAEHGDAYLSAG